MINFLQKILSLSFPRKEQPFQGSEKYWDDRYKRGGHSGAGSAKNLAAFKAEIINSFIEENKIVSIVEYGCGDGNQLKLMHYPQYTGYDVSPTAIQKCKEQFKDDSTKKFKLLENYSGEKAQLSLSLDVIYHLVEDEVFNEYMTKLFSTSDQYVIVYSSNTNITPQDTSPHVRHREFTDWVEQNAENWELLKKIPNRYPFAGDHQKGSFADFYIFKKSHTDESTHLE